MVENTPSDHLGLPEVEALASSMIFNKGARIVPAMKNGKPDGLKLYAIRPSSAYKRLNFQNGDTVHSVNGHDLSDATALFDVFNKVKKAKKLSFEVTRRGKPVTLHIEITK